MVRLKTRKQLDQEKADTARYALGNVILNSEKLLLIYARQSSSKQYVSNIYSAIEQRDGLLERAGELGWTKDEQWILYVENQLAKKTQVSGSLRIDQRPGLQALTEVIESGRASAILE
jgi:DNA invertase Pin-like site-specific DNA recombinase